MVCLGFAFNSNAHTPHAPEPFWERVYRDALNAVRFAVNGGRNNILSEKSFLIGRMVGGELLTEDEARRDLEDAAHDAGLMDRDERAKSLATIERGLRDGIKKPWEDRSPSRPAHAHRPARKPTSGRPGGAGGGAGAAVIDLTEMRLSRLEAQGWGRDAFETTDHDGQPLPADEVLRIILAVLAYSAAERLAGTLGESYLTNRRIGIAPESLRWSRWAHEVLVPLVNSRGRLTAIQRIPVNEDLSRGGKRTAGVMQDAVFTIPETVEGGPVVITDGPEDALSAHEATGWRCIATCGKGRLHYAAAHVEQGTRVLIVRDREKNGNADQRDYTKAVQCLRMRLCDVQVIDPPMGKDVNDITKAGGPAAVLAWLTTEARVFDHDMPLPLPEDEDENEDEEVEAVPAALPEPAGLVRVVRDWVIGTQKRENPELALGAALVALGTAAARRYRTDGNITANLYLMGLAPSGGGKESVIAAVETLLGETNLAGALAGSVPASGAAIRSRAFAYPVAVYLIDEFAHLLREITSPKGAPHLREIMSTWTEIYTKSTGITRSKDYADRRATSSGQECHAPHLTVYGLTNAAGLWDGITPASIADGSIARFLVLGDPDRRSPPKRHVEPRAILPVTIRDALVWIATRPVKGAGNLCDLSMAPPAWHEVPMTQAADDAFWDFESGEQEEAMADATMAPLYARMTENAKRLALVHALGRAAVDRGDPQVTDVDAAWGVGVVRVLVGRMVKRIGRHVARNEQERAHRDVLAIIREARGWIPLNILTRKTQWIRATDRRDILEALIQSGQITMDVQRGRGRAVTVYRVCGPD